MERRNNDDEIAKMLELAISQPSISMLEKQRYMARLQTLRGGDIVDGTPVVSTEHKKPQRGPEYPSVGA